MPLAEEIIDNFHLSLEYTWVAITHEKRNQGPIHEGHLSISIIEQSCHDCHIHAYRIFDNDRNISGTNSKYWVLMVKSMGLKEQLSNICQYWGLQTNVQDKRGSFSSIYLGGWSYSEVSIFMPLNSENLVFMGFTWLWYLYESVLTWLWYYCVLWGHPSEQSCFA